MRFRKVLMVLMGGCVSMAAMAGSHVYSAGDFIMPPMEWRPVPLWFWNNAQVEEDELADQLEQMIITDFYGGCAILPFGASFRPEYLSEEYFSLYGKAIEKVEEHGATMSIYDEYGFPSGSMGAINGSGVTTFKNNHPDHTIKRLDKQEFKTQPGKTFNRRLSSVKNLMSVVAMESGSREIISLRNYMDGTSLSWNVPEEGEWTVMFFTCVTDGDPNVDYLSPEAVQLFVNDTHQGYYDRFSGAFGKTIKSTFFDEPTMYRANGRMWTADFNQKFEAKYGFSPELLYPALWYDIGEKTAAARNMMFGMRATLYSEGFMKTIGDWAEAHGIHSTGHQDQEEVLNPVSVAGDLMLVGKHISMPGIDKIGGDRPAEHFYKVVSSSANNWDKTFVMSETYGDMGNISMERMYNIATEQYTKGVNQLIPHAVWYDAANVAFKPELSWRNPLYNYGLADFNRFLARLNYMLARPGRHVADVAVLYPITTLQAGHYLDGPKGFMQGGVDVPGTDYNVVSRVLTDELGVDFTYLHPEVIDDRCEVQDGRLVMNNEINRETFSVIILPGTKALTSSNLDKIVKSWEAGCTVVFTTQLPDKCANMDGDDATVSAAVARMLAGEEGCGRAIFVENPTAETISAALEEEDLDVRFISGSHPFNYIHKSVDEKDVYYFGNIDPSAAECTISMRGDLSGHTLLDPRSGRMVPAEFNSVNGRTEIVLSLAPGQSIFLVDNSLVDLTDMPDPTPDTGYSVELDFKIEKVSAGVCFAGRDSRNYYMWQINVENPENPMLRPHRWFDGNPSLLGEVALGDKVSVTDGEYHNLRIVIAGDNHAATYIDGVLVDERDGQYPYGLIGFRETHSDTTGSEEAAYFDNVKVVAHEDGSVRFDEDFSSEVNPFSAGTIIEGQLYAAGAMNWDCYAWGAPSNGIHFSLEADMTLVKDDIAFVFAEQAPDTYYMWAVNIFDGNEPRIRHHIFNAGNLTWNDAIFTSFSKEEIQNKPHHVKIEVESAYIRTYIDDVLVDTYLSWSENLRPGLVGFRIDTTGPQCDDAYIDNVKVVEYAADGSETVTLFDDFEPNTPAWFPDAKIEDVDGNNMLHIYGDNVLYKWMQSVTPKDSGFTIEMDVEIESLNAGICFGASDTRNYYMWQINNESYANPMLRPHRWDNGNPSLLGEVSMRGKVDLMSNPVHKVRISVAGDSICSTFIDDVLVDKRKGKFAPGHIGFRQTHSDASGTYESAFFDNIRITSNEDGTVLYSDDFSGENTFSYGDIIDGRLYVKGAMDVDRYSWNWKHNDVWFTLEADMTLVKDDVAFVFSHLNDDDYYMWAVNVFDGNEPRIRHHTFDGGRLDWNDHIFNQYTKDEILGTEHHVTVEVKGARINTYIGEKLVDTYLSFSDKLKPGHVGFRIDTRSEQRDDAYIDNVKVVEYDADGTPVEKLFDDFEPNTPRWFPDVLIEEVDGNCKMHIYGDNVLYKWMQTDSPVLDGIVSVEENEASVDVEYFNLQGMPVANPSRGLYIVRRGHVATKEVIR